MTYIVLYSRPTEASYYRDDNYMPAVVSAINNDGTITVKWMDGHTSGRSQHEGGIGLLGQRGGLVFEVEVSLLKSEP